MFFFAAFIFLCVVGMGIWGLNGSDNKDKKEGRKWKPGCCMECYKEIEGKDYGHIMEHAGVWYSMCKGCYDMRCKENFKDSVFAIVVCVGTLGFALSLALICRGV